MPQEAQEFIDWHSVDQLSREVRQNAGVSCTGLYLLPEGQAQYADQDPRTAPIEASADRSRTANREEVELEGSVRIQQGSQSVEAERIVINRTSGTAMVEGDVVVRDPKARIAAQSGQLNTQQGTAELKDIDLVDYDTQMRIDALRLTRHRNQSLHLSDGSLTTCPPGNRDWQIEAESIDIGPQSIWGVAKNPVFRFKNVPVMWLPFVTFPASKERLTGFLYPEVGFSDNGGLDISAPFYLNLAPNYDLILSPRYIHNRGSALEGLFRHLAEDFRSEVTFAGLPNDKGIDDRDDEDLIEAGIIEPGESNPFIGADRWLLGVQHQGGAKAGGDQAWFSEIDFTRVSDQNYFRDINNTAIDVDYDTHLVRQGTLGYYFSHWSASLSAKSYQTLDYTTVEPYQELPRFNLNGNYLWGGVLSQLSHEAVRFDHAHQFDTEDRSIITGSRARLDYDFYKPWQSIWGFITPGLHLRHLSYRLDQQNLLDTAETQQSYTVPQASLDAGLFFERMGNIVGRDYTQTFEPRLFYFYSDYTDQSDLFGLTADGRDVNFDTADNTFSYNQLFRTSRFAGGDRIDDANQLSIGLTTRFIDSSSGREVLSASIGQILYFADRRVQVNATDDIGTSRSELAGNLSAHIGKRFEWQTSVVYDEKEQLITQGRSSLQYRDPRHRLINIGFNYQRKDDSIVDGQRVERHTRQSDISFILPVAEKLNLIGRNLHDFTFQRELDTFAGLEYNSCCYRARLVWRRWISNDLSRVVDDADLNHKRGWFLDIQFKGFGSSTGKFYNLMSDTIPGYTERENAVYPD